MQYNVGRSLINSLRATLFTYNLEMKYTIDNSFIRRIVGDQKSARECYKATLN